MAKAKRSIAHDLGTKVTFNTSMSSLHNSRTLQNTPFLDAQMWRVQLSLICSRALCISQST